MSTMPSRSVPFSTIESFRLVMACVVCYLRVVRLLWPSPFTFPSVLCTSDALGRRQFFDLRKQFPLRAVDGVPIKLTSNEVPRNRALKVALGACRLNPALKRTKVICTLPTWQNLGLIDQEECRPSCNLLAMRWYCSKPRMSPRVVIYCRDLLGWCTGNLRGLQMLSDCILLWTELDHSSYTRSYHGIRVQCIIGVQWHDDVGTPK